MKKGRNRIRPAVTTTNTMKSPSQAPRIRATSMPTMQFCRYEWAF
jgi:hypothetical protein